VGEVGHHQVERHGFQPVGKTAAYFSFETSDYKEFDIIVDVSSSSGIVVVVVAVVVVPP